MQARFQRVKAALNSAERAGNLAKITLSEYRNGTYPQDLQTAQGTIQLAESDLKRVKDRSEWSEMMLEQGKIQKEVRLADLMTL